MGIAEKSCEEKLNLVMQCCVVYFLICIAVESDAANQVMDLIRDEFVSGDVSSAKDDDSGIKLVAAEEFA